MINPKAEFKVVIGGHADQISWYVNYITDAFAYSNGGVHSILISLAQRYIHTTVEMVHRDDVENVIKLIYETLLEIDHNKRFSNFD